MMRDFDEIHFSAYRAAMLSSTTDIEKATALKNVRSQLRAIYSTYRKIHLFADLGYSRLLSLEDLQSLSTIESAYSLKAMKNRVCNEVLTEMRYLVAQKVFF